MEYQLLGTSGLKISRIGFGAMSLELNNPLNETLLNKALDEGINFFDTADMYQQGLNETLLGSVFREKRKRIILATKVGNQWRADGSGWDWNPSKEYILSAVENSLRRLQTDYIDLYQLHGGTIEDPIEDIIEAFEILKSSGKILNYGISSIRPNVIREYVKRSGIISVMMQYSLLDRRPEESMLPYLLENNVGVLARGTLAKGLLASKSPIPFLNYSKEQVSEIIRLTNDIATKKRSVEAASIHFVLSHPAITSSIIGIRSEEHLKKAIDAVYTNTFSSIEIKMLANGLPINYYDIHR
jgi:aryl-alcohol dehydrogenase-like predicted oxidoreductase